MSELLSEKRLLTELILLYKDFPCLWDTRTPGYVDKKLKFMAYEILLEKYREILENANMHDLKKKIEHIRATYRREHKKVLLSRLVPNTREYKPQLWYYHLMSFINDISDFSNLEPVPKRRRRSMESTSETDDKKRTHSPSSTNCLPDQHDAIDQPSEADMDISTNSILHEELHIKQEIVEYSCPNSPSDDVPEYESFGTTIGLQLKNLEPMQRIIAEKLISNIIFDARLNKLTVNSTVVHS